MHCKQVVLPTALVIATQLHSVKAWAYALAVAESYLCDNFANCQGVSEANCISDTPSGCGACGIQPTLDYNDDITDPPVYENDSCGNPCVTYNPNGLTNDAIQALADDSPAGSLTVAATGVTMNCKKQESKDCSALGFFGNVQVAVYVVCDPTI